METTTQNSMRVFLIGPMKSKQHLDKPAYFMVSVGTKLFEEKPRWCYRMADREKATRLAHQIAFDQCLELVTRMLPEKHEKENAGSLNPAEQKVESPETAEPKLEMVQEPAPAKSKPRPRK